MKKSGENPKAERLPWDGKLNYKLYNHEGEPPFVSSQISNIGKDGLLFLTEEFFPKDSILILKLYHYRDYAPVKVLARVRQSQKNGQTGLWETECVYHDLSPAERGAVDEIVEEVSFIHRVHSKVQKTLHETEEKISSEARPKASGKHGSQRA